MDVLTGNMMESNGQPGKVNVSAVLRDFLLKHFPGYVALPAVVHAVVQK